MMVSNQKIQKLYMCFNAGYNIPQFCMDNDYKHPLIVSDSAELLFDIYTQFTFCKNMNAEFRIVGEKKVVESCIKVVEKDVVLRSVFEQYNENADVIILLAESVEKLPKIKVVSFDELLKRMCTYFFAERPIYDYIKRNPGIKVITYTHPVLIINDYNTEHEQEIVKSDRKKASLVNLGYSEAEASRLLDMPRAKTDYRGCTLFEDSEDELFNVKNGRRQTAYQPEEYENTIWCLGTCVCVGYAAPYDKTMESYLQELLNKNQKNYRVENASQFYNGRYQDIYYVLNALPVKQGDIVLICADNIQVRDVPCFYAKNLFKRPHNYGEVYIDKWHVTEKGYEIIASKFYEFLEENQWFEEYDYNTDLIQQPYYVPHLWGIPDWTDSRVSKHNANHELKLYKQMLRKKRVHAEGKIGAIVMNCNPFTLGHRYLIETAAKMVSHLYIFAVEEDKSIFPFKDRYELIKRGTEDLSNVSVLPSGKFIISSLTFSDYFNKANIQNNTIDASMDVELFAQEIAPELGINVRLGGEEPLDKITQQYNETMKKILPMYGIEFIEIPRKEYVGEVISASRVRKLLEKEEFDIIEKIVPVTTLNYLKNRNVYKNTRLDTIDDFALYVEKLLEMRNEIIVFIVSKDAHTRANKNGNTAKLGILKQLGIKDNLEEMYRWSFAAVIDSGNVVLTKASGSRSISCFYEYACSKVMMISEGFNARSMDIGDGKIIVNRKQCAVDKRGLNFVVVDKKTNKLLDSVCFDFFDNCKVYR